MAAAFGRLLETATGPHTRTEEHPVAPHTINGEMTRRAMPVARASKKCNRRHAVNTTRPPSAEHARPMSLAPIRTNNHRAMRNIRPRMFARKRQIRYGIAPWTSGRWKWGVVYRRGHHPWRAQPLPELLKAVGEMGEKEGGAKHIRNQRGGRRGETFEGESNEGGSRRIRKRGSMGGGGAFGCAWWKERIAFEFHKWGEKPYVKNL